MILAMLFLLSSSLLGFLIIRLLRLDFYFSEQVAAAIILGFVFVIYLGVFFGPYWSFLIFILADLFLIFYIRPSLRLDLSFERRNSVFLLLFLTGVIFFSLLYATLWTNSSLGMHLTSIGVWADWAMHFGLTNFFAEQGKLELTNPFFFRNVLTYPFGADFFSSLLIRLGTSLYFAFIIPGFILSIVIVILLYFLCLRLTKNPWASFLVPFLFFVNGGLSYPFIWEDLKKINFDILRFLSFIPREYAHLYDLGFQWGNVLVFFFLSQRPFIVGLALGLLILNLLLKNHFLFAGILLGLLPEIHPHTFIVLMMVSSFFLLSHCRIRKRPFWNSFFSLMIPALAGGFLYFFWIALYTSNLTSFLYPAIGWLSKGENWLWFWTKNVGILFPLIPIALFSLKVEKNLKIFYLPFLSLFLIGNIFGLQPNLADNNKVFLYWFLASLILVTHYLTKKINSWRKTFFLFLIILSLTFSGVLNILWFFQSQSHFLFLTKEEISLADFVKKNTESKAIFLTSDKHNHPVSTLTGRQILMGYRGWLWTYGIDYRQREKDVLAMFAGGQKAIGLLQKYQVDYIVVGPSELENFSANEDFFRQNFPLFYQSENYKIYKINH